MTYEVLKIDNLQKYYGAKLILDNVNMSLNRGEGAVLVGENGVGKTTLARILLGDEAFDKGKIRWIQEVRLGYLPQEAESPDDMTVREYIESAIGELHAIREKLTFLENRMADPSHADKLDTILEEYGQLQEVFERRGGYDLDSRLEQIFAGLNLSHIDQERYFMSLSGGEKTRVGLGALLLKSPDLLILDEPTNHLDFAGLEWLENYLLAYPNALLMITHDRRFINKVATQIIDLSAVTHSLKVYHGNYEQYLEQREREYQEEVEAYHGQINEMTRLKQVARQEAFARRKGKPISDGDKMLRFKMGQTAQKTQSKDIRDAKQRLAVLEDNKLDNPRHVWHIEFEFEPIPLTSNEPIRLQNLSMRFGERILYEQVTASLHKGDRVAIVAPNGQGKTTLLRIIMGYLQPTSGEITIMPSVVAGYLDQEGETLDLSQNILTNLREVTEGSDSDLLSSLHKSGLFSDAHLARKSIGDLSIGQRRKLGLARLIASRANVLLLDEPTNHLDLLSLEALEDALRDFPGAILSASHDRWFIEHVATQIWRIVDGRLIIEPQKIN